MTFENSICYCPVMFGELLFVSGHAVLLKRFRESVNLNYRIGIRVKFTEAKVMKGKEKTLDRSFSISTF